VRHAEQFFDPLARPILELQLIQEMQDGLACTLRVGQIAIAALRVRRICSTFQHRERQVHVSTQKLGHRFSRRGDRLYDVWVNIVVVSHLARSSLLIREAHEKVMQYGGMSFGLCCARRVLIRSLQSALLAFPVRKRLVEIRALLQQPDGRPQARLDVLAHLHIQHIS
jgi:hypothetical protein